MDSRRVFFDQYGDFKRELRLINELLERDIHDDLWPRALSIGSRSKKDSIPEDILTNRGRGGGSLATEEAKGQQMVKRKKLHVETKKSIQQDKILQKASPKVPTQPNRQLKYIELSGRQCSFTCSCICHNERCQSTPSYLAPIIGRYHLTRSGALNQAKRCTISNCNSFFIWSLRHTFPSWISNRIMYISIRQQYNGWWTVGHISRVISSLCPIISAAARGDIDGVKNELSSGHSPYDVDENGNNLLHIAVRENQYVMCQFLISLGVSCEDKNLFNRTPSDIAWGREIGRPRKPSIATLIDPSEDALRIYNFSEAHRIILDPSRDTPNDQLRFCSTNVINTMDSLGRTPLYWAIRRNDQVAVAELLRHGADGTIGVNPTPWTCRRSHANFSMLATLLKHGVDPNGSDLDGHTALHLCAMYGLRREYLQILLSFGACIDFEYKGPYFSLRGVTALGFAVLYRKMNIIRLLLDLGADVNHQDEQGRSILHLAVLSPQYRDADLVLLLERGSAIDVRDKEGFSPAARAMSLENVGKLQILNDHGASLLCEPFSEVTVLSSNLVLKDCQILQWPLKMGWTKVINWLLPQLHLYSADPLRREPILDDIDRSIIDEIVLELKWGFAKFSALSPLIDRLKDRADNKPRTRESKQTLDLSEAQLYDLILPGSRLTGSRSSTERGSGRATEEYKDSSYDRKSLVCRITLGASSYSNVEAIIPEAVVESQSFEKEPYRMTDLPPDPDHEIFLEEWHHREILEALKGKNRPEGSSMYTFRSSWPHTFWEIFSLKPDVLNLAILWFRRWSQSLRSEFRRMCRSLFRPSIPPGHARIKWNCWCGKEVYADFPDHDSNAIKELSDALNSTTQGQMPHSESVQNETHLPTMASSNENGPVSSNETIGPSPQRSITEKNSHVDVPQNLKVDTKYLELCINTGKLCQSLGEIELRHINSDAELFRWVRKRYKEIQGPIRRWTHYLTKPVAMRFVFFGLEHKKKVHIFQKDVYPTPEHVASNAYHYAPCPMSPSLWMPSSTFIHYLCYCDDADLTKLKHVMSRVWLDRLPKKMQESLASTSEELAHAYGLHIIEGANRPAILWTLFCVLAICSGPVIAYVILKKDVQGATGIGGLILTVLTLLAMASTICENGQG